MATVTAHAQLGILSPATEQVLGVDTYEPVEGYDTDGPSSSNVTTTLASGTLTPSVTGDYRLIFSASMSGAGGAETFWLSFAVDGTEVGPEWSRRVGGSDVGAVAGFYDLALTAGEAVTLHVKSTGGADVTFETLTFGLSNLA